MSPATATNRIDRRFAELAEAGRKAFVVYLCAGDPDLAATEALVPAIAAAGADVIELGIPYSDPMADGPAIQAATERALASGTTVKKVFASLRRIRKQTEVPVLLFTYLNPVLAYGVEAFGRDAVAAGADGVLLLDLPVEEEAEVFTALRAAGMATVCLVAPNTVPARRQQLAAASTGFLYYVCRYGVTGERAELPKDLQRQVASLKRASAVPVCIGFGISTPEQAAQAAGYGDGVVVGSHLVRMIERHGGKRTLARTVAKRVRELASAVHGG